MNFSPASDEIQLHGLDLPVKIGVPEEERAIWQSLQADILIRTATRFEDLDDAINRTIDYAAVAMRLRAIAAERPRQLIETLAAELAHCILNDFGAVGVSITLHKRILPGCDRVSVNLTRP